MCHPDRRKPCCMNCPIQRRMEGSLVRSPLCADIKTFRTGDMILRHIDGICKISRLFPVLLCSDLPTPLPAPARDDAHSDEGLCPCTMGDMPNHHACHHAPAVKIKAHAAPRPIKIPPQAAPPLCALRFALCPPLPCAAGHTKIPRPCQAGDFFLYQNTSFSTMVCSRDGPTLMMPRGTPMSLEISSR